ncbi:transposase, partial [Desulforhopalus singaporensis]
MSAHQRRKYDSEFKRNAVLLTEDPDRTVREVADSLGISADLLYQWRKRYRQQGDLAFPGNGKVALTPEQQRIQELEKRLKDAEME